MPLYLGSEQITVTAPNMKYRLRISNVSMPDLGGIMLKLVDDSFIKDSNDLYLTVEEGEQ